MKSILAFFALTNTILSTVLVGFFAWVWFTKSRLPYHNGSFFDEEAGVVYHEQAMDSYGIVIIAFILIAVTAGLLTKKLFKKIT